MNQSYSPKDMSIVAVDESITQPDRYTYLAAVVSLPNTRSRTEKAAVPSAIGNPSYWGLLIAYYEFSRSHRERTYPGQYAEGVWSLIQGLQHQLIDNSQPPIGTVYIDGNPLSKHAKVDDVKLEERLKQVGITVVYAPKKYGKTYDESLGPPAINLLGLADRIVKHYRRQNRKSDIKMLGNHEIDQSKRGDRHIVRPPLEKVIISSSGTIHVISADRSLIIDPYHHVE